MAKQQQQQHPIRMYLDNPNCGAIWRVVGYQHNGMIGVELMVLKEGELCRIAKEIGFYASEWPKIRAMIDSVAEKTVGPRS